ncbi:MAG: hypothetical protein V3V14_03780 [Saprospiraceae bacterium]
MKQDNLEKYISDHRGEFDSDVPPPLVWLNMEKELVKKEKNGSITPNKSKLILMRFMRIAAMFVIVLGAGLMIGMQVKKSSIPINIEYQEYQEVEHHYAKKVKYMWSEIEAIGINDSSIEQDLDQLDAVYLELKSELTQNPNVNTDMVINALLKNYKTKTEILEVVLDRYQSKESNNKLNIEDGKVKI